MPRLFLRFTSQAERADDEGFDATLDWLIHAGGVTTAQGHTDARALSEVIENKAPWADEPDNVVVFVPTAEVLALSCQVPGRNVTQLRRATPYVVEEFITQDIETMHVACGDLARNEPVRCLIAPRASVRDWLDCLTAAGVTPGFMTADAMALATGPGQLSALYEGESALVRTAEQLASIDVQNLPATLEIISASIAVADQPPVLRQIHGTLSEIDLSQSGFAPAQVENVDFEGSLLDYLAGDFDGAHAINLLQEEFAVKGRSGGAWKQWQSAAALAVAWLVLGALVMTAEGLWAGYKADALREQAGQLYRELYNTESAPGNPAARMRLRIGQVPVTTTGFHHLLGNLGVALQELTGRYELRSLSYSERSGLGAEAIIDDYDVLEQLQLALEQLGFDLEVVSAEQHQGRVRANLRIAGG